jgi:hypothetical protein
LTNILEYTLFQQNVVIDTLRAEAAEILRRFSLVKAVPNSH